ncbi:YopB/SseC family type III secretion system translocon subunit [Aliivibrio fischeri]|uniref:type III secretion system translocon subunit SctE n=1 Tax=Aliivibrio fischeri TaxID=668 RepID=UPI0012D99D5C|nr:type III secretion system translocon subunit SctE [Aliivibrio fischeri]MUK39178.1 YopB/SseC family type III secretion system translocon subunit [Aliivibrio fischeri]MUL04122.1 YopB/SseC family type III secretion system translocon subunit [Aliivibrio fischeri]MUL06652.1 YopB/SseC family type III secretion system translocon subunit [Aliivibrio fischeri]
MVTIDTNNLSIEQLVSQLAVNNVEQSYKSSEVSKAQIDSYNKQVIESNNKVLQEQMEKNDIRRGPFARIFGWVAGIAAVVAAPFSGGASLGLTAAVATSKATQEIRCSKKDKSIEIEQANIKLNNNLMQKQIETVSNTIGQSDSMYGHTSSIVEGIDQNLSQIIKG